MPHLGFFDLDERFTKVNERAPQVNLNNYVDWEAFRARIGVRPALFEERRQKAQYGA